MIFNSEYDQHMHMTTVSHLISNSRFIELKGMEMLFRLLALKLMFLMQVRYMIIIRRRTRIHSGAIFDVTRFNEHIVRENHE